MRTMLPEFPDLSAVASPALVIFRDRVQRNINQALAVVGDEPRRLRPHVKTHKCAQVAGMMRHAGITRFKCATLAEAHMLAGVGAEDVLLAMPLVGPAVTTLTELREMYPDTRFSTIADDVNAVESIARVFNRPSSPLPVFLDLDVGMGRTGIAPGEEAAAVYRAIHDAPGLKAAGLHLYDGHRREADLDARKAASEREFGEIRAFEAALDEAGLPVPAKVAGGTPSFPVHAEFPDRECSPGTFIFHDAMMLHLFPDLPFEPAAWLLTRVVSKPRSGRLTLDLGHKAVASENPPDKRVRFPALGEWQFVAQSEEHLVIETPDAGKYRVGDPLFGLPWHICPTVALHDQVTVVEGGEVVDRWPVKARNRTW